MIISPAAPFILNYILIRSEREHRYLVACSADFDMKNEIEACPFWFQVYLVRILEGESLCTRESSWEINILKREGWKQSVTMLC